MGIGKMLAGEDQSAPIPKEITSEPGRIICYLVRLPHVDQYGCPSKKRETRELRGIIYQSVDKLADETGNDNMSEITAGS